MPCELYAFNFKPYELRFSVTTQIFKSEHSYATQNEDIPLFIEISKSETHWKGNLGESGISKSHSGNNYFYLRIC